MLKLTRQLFTLTYEHHTGDWRRVAKGQPRLDNSWRGVAYVIENHTLVSTWCTPSSEVCPTAWLIMALMMSIDM